MYRATLKEGKTYHVGGVTFIKGTPRVVSDELGEYLKTVAVFEVEELPYHEGALEGLHATDSAPDLIRVAGAENKHGATLVGSPSGSAPTSSENRKPRRAVKRGK